MVFPDGSEYPNAPVLNSDLVGDLAVIGPLDTGIAPVALVDGEDLPIGSNIFMTGYSGVREEFPQPAIARGLLSQLREWEPIQMTYLQMTYLQGDAGVAEGLLTKSDCQGWPLAHN